MKLPSYGSKVVEYWQFHVVQWTLPRVEETHYVHKKKRESHKNSI